APTTRRARSSTSSAGPARARSRKPSCRRPPSATRTRAEEAVMLRAPLLAAARSRRMRSWVEAVPATRSVVRRFVAGSDTADAVGATVTLDMEDHTTTDSTLGILRELRGEYPWVGAVLQAYLRRTEQDCRELSGPGSRVRLCKGAYAEPESVAFPEKSEVDKS